MRKERTPFLRQNFFWIAVAILTPLSTHILIQNSPLRIVSRWPYEQIALINILIQKVEQYPPEKRALNELAKESSLHRLSASGTSHTFFWQPKMMSEIIFLNRKNLGLSVSGLSHRDCVVFISATHYSQFALRKGSVSSQVVNSLAPAVIYKQGESETLIEKGLFEEQAEKSCRENAQILIVVNFGAV